MHPLILRFIPLIAFAVAGAILTKGSDNEEIRGSDRDRSSKRGAGASGNSGNGRELTPAGKDPENGETPQEQKEDDAAPEGERPISEAEENEAVVTGDSAPDITQPE